MVRYPFSVWPIHVTECPNTSAKMGLGTMSALLVQLLVVEFVHLVVVRVPFSRRPSRAWSPSSIELCGRSTPGQNLKACAIPPPRLGNRCRRRRRPSAR